MILFNNSNYRGYILGHVITTNTIYNIPKFEERFIYFIRNTIKNVEVIKILNKMFSPIKGDPSYPDICETYDRFLFKHIKGKGNIIYNNTIMEANEFFQKYELCTFNVNDIILLYSDIEYNEQFVKESDNVKNVNTSNL